MEEAFEVVFRFRRDKASHLNVTHCPDEEHAKQLARALYTSSEVDDETVHVVRRTAEYVGFM